MPTQAPTALRRRGFLTLGGATAAGLLVAGCGGETGEPAATQARTEAQSQDEPQADVVLDFSTAAGVANLAYALEQLQAGFYARALDELRTADDHVRAVLDELLAHERVHLAFFEALLGDDAIGALEVDFSSVDLADRRAVVETASTLESLGVAAYNGAARHLDAEDELGADVLMAAGDIVAVEARHASVVNSLLAAGHSGRFAPGAFDDAMEPGVVLQAAGPFLATSVAVRDVPEED